MARSQIEGIPARRGIQELKTRQVPLGEIDDVNVIADTGAIGRWIVRSENIDLWQRAGRHLCNERHQIIGNASRVLADQSTFMCTNRIEIAQAGDAP